MSKKSKSTKKAQKSPQMMWVAVAVVAVVLAAGAVFTLTGTPDTAAPGAAPVAAAPIVSNISPQTYMTQFAESGAAHFLLDVRTPEEFNSGHISGAANISVQTLASRLDEVPKDQPVVIYCRSGNRSAQAASILRDAGYTEIYDLGGVIDWTAQGLPLQ
jgi:rhodanese-related sulfurtransferase